MDAVLLAAGLGTRLRPHTLTTPKPLLAVQGRPILDWTLGPQGTPRGTGDALRKCREHIHSERFLVINGDDLFGAVDFAKLAACPAGLIVQEVQEPKKYGIAFLKPDGTLEKLLEKPDLPPPQLANTGAYVFPRSVFEFDIAKSPRGEYEI